MNRLRALLPSLNPLLLNQQIRTVKMDATLKPLAGLWKPTALKGLYYGPDVVKNHLLSCLPADSSKAFIITGASLANKTPLIKQVEEVLGSKHAGTFSDIKEHAPVAQLDQATEKVHADNNIDTIIAIGGGSPIDSAKAISYRLNEKHGKFLHHICIPTTLSAAECTAIGGFTKEDGVKTGISHPNVFASYILYDPKFALHTPPSLFASTGIRALDHAVELQYHPTATLVPCRSMCLLAIQELFHLLPEYQKNPKDEDIITRLYLAAYSSFAFLGLNVKGGLGLSHTMGYALGSPYGIPHGITSCMTLGHVVKLKARASKEDAAKIALILPMIGDQPSGDVVGDAGRVGDRINKLVADLGFKTTLTEKGVGKDQVDTIVARATGGLTPDQEMSEEQKKQYSGIKQLVESLY